MTASSAVDRAAVFEKKTEIERSVIMFNK